MSPHDDMVDGYSDGLTDDRVELPPGLANRSQGLYPWLAERPRRSDSQSSC